MEYITSRGFGLPQSAKEMADGLWFNMWERRLWPFEEIVAGDSLYWYESKSRSLVWNTRVARVHRLRYTSKREVAQALGSVFGRFDGEDPYFKDAPPHGYCLAYKVAPRQRMKLPKPASLRFPQIGWRKIDAEIARKWLSKPAEDDLATLDDSATDGPLAHRLRMLDEQMRDVSPDRVKAIVSQTIRKDTKIVKALKELCRFQCQFPGCGMSIRKRDGSSYIEVAHIEPVRKGGKSVLGNLIVLCPNHHKEFDYGELAVEEQTLEYVRGRLNGKPFEMKLPLAAL